VPAWAADVCWYHVFVSRFCNADPSNDLPGTWPWTADWLTQPPERPPDRRELFFRRYGGDLQGVRSRLDYIQGLGVNAIYLSPIFAAASEHKYDASDYRHVDDSYGVAGALSCLSGETADPDTWQWSDSDRVFLDLVGEAHRRGLRIILDGVFNHVGRDFWAFRDVVEKGAESPYADWFDITDFGPPMHWNAWDGPDGNLVRFARHGDGLAPPVEEHLFAVTRRWMDPNGDGDPSDGIDGWRLDAAEQVDHGFWKRWRRLVKSINTEALIVGEIWPNPRDWLAGDEFDVVTNYRLARAVVRFCRPGAEGYTATRFASQLEALARQFDHSRTLAMANILGSHDTDRLASMMANPRRRFDSDNLPGEGSPPYDQGLPGDQAYARQRFAAALQFTLPGAPMIYNGDEVGMHGGEDPYCRAPMWWPQQSGQTSEAYRPDLLTYYRNLASLRRELAPLRRGDFRIILADDARRIVAFSRDYNAERVVILANGSAESRQVILNIGEPHAQVVVVAAGSPPARATAGAAPKNLDAGGRIALSCPPLSVQLVRFRPPV
jgi:glycosidase